MSKRRKEQWYPYDGTPVRSYRGELPGQLGERRRTTIISSFDNRLEAERAYDAQMNDFKPEAIVVLFGNSVCLTLDPEHAYVAETWERVKHNPVDNIVFIPGSYPVLCSFVCQMQDESVAQQLEEIATTYLTAFIIPLRLIPPWHPLDSRTPEEVASHLRSRRTLRRLLNISATINEDPQRQRAKIAELRASESSLLDLELVELYDQQLGQDAEAGAESSGNFPNLDWSTVGNKLGQLPMSDGKLVAGAGRYSSTGGYVDRRGRDVDLDIIELDNTYDALPAFAAWLCRFPSERISYVFHDRIW